jgi:hypothetical protein
VLVRLLADLFVLLLQFNHIVLEFEYLLLLGIADVLHLNDAVFENLVRLFELLNTLLQAHDCIILLYDKLFNPTVLSRKLLSSSSLFLEFGLQRAVPGAHNVELNSLFLELLQ